MDLNELFDPQVVLCTSDIKQSLIEARNVGEEIAIHNAHVNGRRTENRTGTGCFHE